MKQASLFRMAGIIGLLMASVVVVIFLKAVNISLLHYWQQWIPFSFREHLQEIGGFAGFLAIRFADGLIKDFTGIASILLLVLLVYFSFVVVFRSRKDYPLFHPFLLAAIIPFVSIFAYYRLPLVLTMEFVIGLLLSVLYTLPEKRSFGMSAALALVLGLAAYWLAAGVGLIIFLQVIIIRALLQRRYAELIFLIPLCCIPLLALCFDTSIPLKLAYLGSFNVSMYDLVPALFYVSLVSPLAVLVLLMASSKLQTLKPLLLSFLVFGGVLAGVAGIALTAKSSVQKVERAGYGLMEAGFEDKWDEVLGMFDGDLYINTLIQYKLNRALQQEGLLLDRMFYFPQEFGEKGLFMEGYSSSYVTVHLSDFYYDLGFANEARHWAAEAQMALTRHPVVLKQLIMSYAAIGAEDAARKYLRVLERSRIHRKWSREIMAMLDDGSLNQHPDIIHFRKNNPEEDFFAFTSNPTKKLMIFYSMVPENRMVLEYLLASYMLQHRLGNVMARIGEFRRLGYAKLPRHIQEAVLIYMARTHTQQVDLSGYIVEQETLDAFKEFSTLAVSAQSRNEKMQKVAKFRNTYWYYFLFTSPYVSKD